MSPIDGGVSAAFLEQGILGAIVVALALVVIALYRQNQALHKDNQALQKESRDILREVLPAISALNDAREAIQRAGLR